MPASPGNTASPLPLIKLAFDRSGVYGLAKQLADDNRVYFRCLSASQFRHRFTATCDALANDLPVVESCAKAVSSSMLRYDFDANTPGNGYRSIIAILDSSVLHLIRLLRDIKEQREYVLFRTNYFCKELEAYASVLAALKRDLYYATDHLYLWKTSDQLFPPEVSHQKLDALMNMVETFDHSCFYGRCMGFQYVPSLFRVFQVVGFGLASYSILWEKGAPDSISQTVTNLYQSGRFALNPEERAQRIADVIMNADISFCKSFWNLTEGPFLQEIPKWFCPNMALNEQWNLPAKDPLFIESTNGYYVKITPPSAHTGPGPVSLRVMSFKKRAGMVNPFKDSFFGSNGTSTSGCVPKSPNLLFHCHGGGFVATSSKTHEIYLRQWAQNLDCTIVSVDYSLAPEHPFPRAVEEVLYAYAWVLNNADRLGWTGEKVCFAGDSAGAHILMSITLRCLQMTISRMPDGLVLIYAPFMVEYSPSPSRLLSFLDPLLPPGIMARCIAAYLGVTEIIQNKEGDEVKSPITSNKATLSEYAFKLKHNAQRHTLPEYELNLNATSRSATPTNVSGMDCSSKSASPKVDGDHIVNFYKISNGSVLDGKSSAVKENGVAGPNPVLFTLESEDGTCTTPRIETPPSDDQTSASPKQQVDSKTATETPRVCRPKVQRQRSHSDTVVEKSALSSKQLRSVDENEELTSHLGGDEDKSSDQQRCADDMATVRIRRDPRRIVVSSGAYDRVFMEYLSKHEITNKSLVRLRVPSSVDGAALGCESTQLPLSGRRSFSTSSLSSLGEKLGTVTGYVWNGLSAFMDTPASPTLSTIETPPISPDLSSHRKGATTTPQPTLTDVPRSRLSHFHNLKVPRDPVLSPLRADDQLLAKLPRVSLVACHFDPLLDDSVTFAKRLKQVGVPVTLDLLDSLPHGFLNFTVFSPECLAGSTLCYRRIQQLFDAPRRDLSADQAPPT